MKLLKQDGAGWHYALNETEAVCLRSLLREFPVTANAPARITRTDVDPRVAEREQLLNESLAEHRAKLQRQARGLVAADKLKAGPDGWRLRLNPEERETFLQILNDIRLGLWHALGEPECLDPQTPGQKPNRDYSLMHLAGYFEFMLLELEAQI